MADRKLSELEQLVLLACVRLGDAAYTVAVADDIEERTGREAAHAAVYLALRRLEAKGFVTSALGESTPERGGRPKRFFTVSPQALPALREARDRLLNMWEGLEGAGR